MIPRTPSPLLSAALGAMLTLCVAGAHAAVSPAPPPFPPLPRSPVEIFRELLAMAPDARRTALEARSENQRRILQARLAEYESLPPAAREERLRATDLYWHLSQILRRAPEQRAALIALSPEDLRPILAERIAIWEQLPADDQRVLLEQDRAIRYFAAVRRNQPPPLPGEVRAPTSPLPRGIQEDLASLQRLTPEQRRRVREQWSRFFEAPAPQVDRTLRAMNAVERRQLTTVLKRLGNLSPEQRRTCIDAFARFATMPPEERATFLWHAERWAALAPEERAAWRSVAARLPPLPPQPQPPPRQAAPPAKPPRPPGSEG